MTDTNTPNDGGNVVDFARRTGRTGFTLTPTTTLDTPVIPPLPAAPPATPTAVTDGGRRSPLDIVNALPDPSLLQPPIAPPAPLTPAPGMVPDTFRAEPAGDMVGPRLGALSLAACLAVAVAALRGTHTVLSTWWENRMARQAETAPLREARLKHQLAMQNIADKGAQQHAKTNKVPSSSEFGRKSLGGRGGGKGGTGSSLFGSSGGGGRGRSGKSSTGAGSAGATRSPKTPKKPTSKGPGVGLGGGTKQNNSRTRKQTPNTPRTPKGPKGPHRTSQGGGAGLRKHRTNTPGATDKTNTRNGRGGSGKDRRSLAGALTRDTSKAAQRRLKRRRKHGLDKPALWAGDTRTNRKTPNDRTNRKNRLGKDTHPRNRTTDTKDARRGRKDGPDMKLGPTAWRDLRKAAVRRWKKRQKRDGRTVPPLWKDAAARTRKANNDTKAKTRPDTGEDNTTSKKTGQSKWERARDYARAKAGGSFFGDDSATAGPAGAGGAGAQAGTGPAGGWGTTSTGPTGDWRASSAGPNAGPAGGRRNPFANAGQAAPTTYTVTRDDYPGAQAKRWEPSAVTAGQAALPRTGPAALDAAPTSHTARPSTTRPKEPIAMPPARPDARIAKAKKQAARSAVATVGRQMAEQHETEITLDDACDAADELSERGFKTNDQASKLSRRAEQLRGAWLNLADKCADDNNLIGDLFTLAALKFAESMELVDRMAEEMAASSLEAAEKAETAGNEINDAYRPYNIATADGGLTTPSAPVHNEA